MRPSKCRYAELDPKITVFKPRGVPTMELITIDFHIDELEAIRLADYERFDIPGNTQLSIPSPECEGKHHYG